MSSQRSRMFDEKRFTERVASTIRNIRSELGTKCAGVDLSQVTDQMLYRAVSPALRVYDSELYDLWDDAHPGVEPVA